MHSQLSWDSRQDSNEANYYQSANSYNKGYEPQVQSYNQSNCDQNGFPQFLVPDMNSSFNTSFCDDTNPFQPSPEKDLKKPNFYIDPQKF